MWPLIGNFHPLQTANILHASFYGFLDTQIILPILRNLLQTSPRNTAYERSI